MTSLNKISPSVEVSSSSEDITSGMDVKHSPRLNESLQPSLSLSEKNPFQELKARTMYKMVELINDGKALKKMLYLTSFQAKMLATTKGSTQKLLDAFEVYGKPKLVIDLIISSGITSFNEPADNRSPCFRSDIEPFLDRAGRTKAVKRLTEFFVEILLPLIVRANAIVVCDAGDGNCMLSEALGKAIAIERGKWKGALPFTIISKFNWIQMLYFRTQRFFNEEKAETQYWEKLMKKSTSWQPRHDAIKKFMESDRSKTFDDNTTLANTYDLNSNLPNYIIVEGIEDKQWDYRCVFSLCISVHLYK